MSRQAAQASRFLDTEVLETLLDAPEVMVWMTDERHLCHYVSPALAAFTGIRNPSMLGLKWIECVHPEDRDRCRSNQRVSAEFPGNFRHEYRVLRPDGENRWAIDMGIARFDRRGKFRGYIGLVSDITEQKKAEFAARDRQRSLEREILEISERERRRIGRDLHDGLNQKLLAISLSCHLLEKSLRKKLPVQAPRARKVREEIQDTIRQVRDVSRALAPVNLGREGFPTALAELAAFLHDTFGARVQITGAAPFAQQDIEISIHLYRIIQEALTNAVRHGRSKKIHIAFRSVKGGHRLSVRDDGRGLPKQPRTGGMGLATMRYRAELLNGRLQLRNRRPRGAEVRIDFKLPASKRSVP